MPKQIYSYFRNLQVINHYFEITNNILKLIRVGKKLWNIILNFEDNPLNEDTQNLILVCRWSTLIANLQESFNREWTEQVLFTVIENWSYSGKIFSRDGGLYLSNFSWWWKQFLTYVTSKIHMQYFRRFLLASFDKIIHIN